MTGRCRTWCDDVVPPQASPVVASPLDLDSPWAPASVLQVTFSSKGLLRHNFDRATNTCNYIFQVWELPSMQQLQICLLDWALLLSQGKWASGASVVQSTSLLGPMGLSCPLVPGSEKELCLLLFVTNRVLIIKCQLSSFASLLSQGNMINGAVMPQLPACCMSIEECQIQLCEDWERSQCQTDCLWQIK